LREQVTDFSRSVFIIREWGASDSTKHVIGQEIWWEVIDQNHWSMLADCERL